MTVDGSRLPGRRLCLTFDDGPSESVGETDGPRTMELGRFLASKGISATFFMCGRNIEQYPGHPAQLQGLGHVVGNHTYSHERLIAPDGSTHPGKVRAEFRTTLYLLRDAGVTEPMPFRPPFGDWNAQCATALRADPELAAALYGPFHWEFRQAEDWQFWDPDKYPPEDVDTVKLCVSSYMNEVRQRDTSGVVLMHDGTMDNSVRRQGNRTLLAVQALLAELQEMKIGFAGIREVWDAHQADLDLEGVEHELL